MAPGHRGRTGPQRGYRRAATMTTSGGNGTNADRSTSGMTSTHSPGLRRSSPAAPLAPRDSPCLLPMQQASMPLRLVEERPFGLGRRGLDSPRRRLAVWAGSSTVEGFWWSARAGCGTGGPHGGLRTRVRRSRGSVPTSTRAGAYAACPSGRRSALGPEGLLRRLRSRFWLAVGARRGLPVPV